MLLFSLQNKKEVFDPLANKFRMKSKRKTGKVQLEFRLSFLILQAVREVSNQFPWAKSLFVLSPDLIIVTLLLLNSFVRFY